MPGTVFIGATRGLGRALSREMARQGEALHVLGRSADDIARTAADLAAVSDRAVTASVCDLEDPATFAPALDEADRRLGGFDRLVVTAGLFGTQDELESDRARAERVLRVNFVNTVLLCEETRLRMLLRGGGHIVVFSSVAGERGRRPVVLYGASKAGLTAYLEGLDARYKLRGLDVTIVKPGFVRTGMTAGLKEPPFAADPDDVVPAILRGIRARRTVVYAPPVWAAVMAVIRALPRFVMRRVSF